jgi:hypothetical protein
LLRKAPQDEVLYAHGQAFELRARLGMVPGGDGVVG